MAVAVFAQGVDGAVPIIARATELAFLFVCDVLVLFARAGRAVAISGRVAEATFAHAAPFDILAFKLLL